MFHRKTDIKWQVCDGGCIYAVKGADRVRKWQTIAEDFVLGFDVNGSEDMSVLFDIYLWGVLVETVSRTAQPEKISKYQYCG